MNVDEWLKLPLSDLSNVDLLKEWSSEAPRREPADIHEKEIVIYGAGFLGRAIAKLAGQNGMQVLHFVDRNAGLLGQTVDGLPVRAEPPLDVEIVVAVHNWREPFENLLALYGERVRPYFALLLGDLPDLLPFRCLQHPEQLSNFLASGEFEWTLEHCETSEDRVEYLRQVAGRYFAGLFRDRTQERDGQSEWFPASLPSLKPGDVFLDGGAYIGDTVEEVNALSSGRNISIVAVEPDLTNFLRLAKYVKESELENVEVLYAALSSCSGAIEMSNTSDMASKVSEGGVLCNSISIDDIFSQRDLSRVKLDLEGFEAEALRGASEAIGSEKIFWSIATYHLAEDLTSIPRFFMDRNVMINVRSAAARPWDTAFHFRFP